jgi:hypothetical protein
MQIIMNRDEQTDLPLTPDNFPICSVTEHEVIKSIYAFTRLLRFLYLIVPIFDLAAE